MDRARPSGDDTVLTEVLVFVPEGGRRSRGRPRLRFYDTVKSDLIARSIAVTAKLQKDFWPEVAARAADRKKWRVEVVDIKPV